MNELASAQAETSLPSQRELEGLADDVLREARRQGADAAEAAVSHDSGLVASVRMGDVETLEYNRDRSLMLSVYFGARKGSASTSDLSRKAIAETVTRACTIARYTAEDPCVGLADPQRMAGDVPDLDLDHPWDITPESAIELALACENAAREVDSRIDNSEGASASSHRGLVVYGNTHGFVGGFPSTQHSLSCAVIGRDGDRMQRDYWYTVARAAEDLETALSVGQRAGERTVRRLGAQRLSTRQAPVLLVPEMARGLLSQFVSAIRGSKLYRQASFLVDHMGESIFPEFVRLHEQPHLMRALASAPFDGEGVATQDRDVVTDGVLEGYVLDAYSACRLGMQTTGNAGGVHNLTLDPGPYDFDGLMREMDTGLVVTEMMGMGVNLVTGDYSRGAAGYWVEGGEIQYPVEEITVAGNLREMFRGIVAAGNDVDTRGGIRTGSLLIEKMTIAGE